MKLQIALDSDHFGRIAADYIVQGAAENSNLVLGLATGNTPIPLYKRLVDLYRRKELDMSGFLTINLDEYLGIEPEHPSSFRTFMKTHLFDHVNLDETRTHIPKSNPVDIHEECIRYHQLFINYGYPDLMVLGIGLNGHIGFNEPGTPFDSITHMTELSLQTRKANAPAFGGDYRQVPTQAITMGIGEIMNSKRILLLATGESKASILLKALKGAITPEVPASILQTHPDLVVITDEAAASLL